MKERAGRNRSSASTKGYVVIENDHALELANGRILIPINVHSYEENGRICVTSVGKMTFAASDDDGCTWKRLCEDYSLPFEKYSRTGLQETPFIRKNQGGLRRCREPISFVIMSVIRMTTVRAGT